MKHHPESNSVLFLNRMSVVIALVFVVLTNSAKAERITHRFNFCADSLAVSTKTSPDNTEYSLITYQGLETLDSPGHPSLPVKTVRFIVPTLSRNHKIFVNEFSNNKRERLEFIPYPSQDKSPSSGEVSAFTKPDLTSYGLYDGTPVADVIDNTLWDGDCRIITVAVSPCGYDGKSNEISVSNSVEISVDFDLCTKEEAGLLPNALIRNSKNLNLESHIVNTEDIPSNMRKSTKAAPVQSEFKGQYYIITNADLVPYFHDLALWKRQKGYEVTVKSVESIVKDSRFSPNGTSGREDNAAAVRSYLINEYNNRTGKMYCLLAGNEEEGLPIRYVKDTEAARRDTILPTDPYYNVTKGVTFVPTDNYFCDMTTNWSLYWDDGAQVFTCKKGTVKFCFDIAVGRLMCRTQKEINNYTKKLILYESNPGYGDNDYLGRIFFSEQEQMEGESDIVLGGFTWYEDDEIDILQDYLITKDEPGPAGRDLIAAMRNHGYVSLHGHGSPECIIMTGCHKPIAHNHPEWPRTGITALDSYEILNIEPRNGLEYLNNSSKPFVLYSIACTTNPFDDYTYKDGSSFRENYTYNGIYAYNMGESFTLGSNYGGPAFLSNSRNGWVWTSSRMEQNFGKAITETQSPKIGWLENRSKELGDDTHIRLCHSLIGEPEFELWTRKPQSLAISFDIAGSIARMTGIGLTGSIVSVTDGVNKLAIENVSSNYCSIPLGNLKSSIILCSVWKSGYLPLIKLFANNGTLSDYRSFIVRDAYIGRSDPYNIVVGGALDISAVDTVDVYNLSISKGSANLRCDNAISVQKLTGKNNASIKLCGNTVELKPGFFFFFGSVLHISNSDGYNK